MSAYSALRFLHLLAVMVLVAGIIGDFVAELRIRRAANLATLAEGVQYQTIFMEWLVFPAAVIVGLSGVLLVLKLGIGFFELPWLTGMWLLFAFEFVEGNTVTRRHGLYVRRELEHALRVGAVTAGLRRRLKSVPGTFGLCLDLPLGLVMVSLGVMRPSTWSHFLLAVPAAVVVASVLTALLLRLEPSPSERSPHALEQASP